MMTLPWEQHRHVEAAEPDEEGDCLCIVCGLVMRGPLADEAREILSMLNAAARGGGR